MSRKTGLFTKRINALDMEYSVILAKTMDDCIELLYEEFPDFTELVAPDNGNIAFTVTGSTRQKSKGLTEFYQSFAIVLPEEFNGQKLRTVAHEATHLVWEMCEHSGIVINYENQEVYSLLVEHVFETIRKIIYGTPKV